MEQKHNAKKRGIEWLFSFDTWWQMWKDKFNWRGASKGKYCMARKGDEGPYSPENCEIILLEANVAERNRWVAEQNQENCA